MVPSSQEPLEQPPCGELPESLSAAQLLNPEDPSDSTWGIWECRPRPRSENSMSELYVSPCGSRAEYGLFAHASCPRPGGPLSLQAEVPTTGHHIPLFNKCTVLQDHSRNPRLEVLRLMQDVPYRPKCGLGDSSLSGRTCRDVSRLPLNTATETTQIPSSLNPSPLLRILWRL